MSVFIQLRSVLDSIESPRIVINSDYTVSYINQAFVHAFNVTNYIGMHCYEVMFNRLEPCDKCGDVCPLKQSLTANSDATIYHTLIHPKDGTLWDIEMSPIMDDNNRNIYFLGGLTRRTGHMTHLELGNIVARSVAMQSLMRRLSKLCNTELPILFIGPQGAGKRALGKLVHDNSKRRQYDFIKLNCETLTPENFSGELYQHFNKNWGMVCGTLYLSNIDLLNEELQGSLLNMLETGAFTHKEGSTTKTVRVNLRCTTAGNCL